MEHWTVEETLERLEAATGPARYVEPFVHGSLRLGLYAPRDRDPQQPHEQDELYIVVSGHGTFVRAGERTNFATGDVLFVAAGEEHRFEEFSDDFATWVVFWGPAGGGG